MSEFFSSNFDSLYPVDRVDYENFNAFLKAVDQMVMDQNRMSSGVESAMLGYFLGHFLPLRARGERVAGTLEPFMLDVFSARRHQGRSTDPFYVGRLLEFSIDDQMRRLFPHEYPAHAIKPDFWTSNEIVARLDYEKLMLDLYGDLQSNQQNGAAIYHLLFNALQAAGRLDGPVVLDTGISMAQPWKKLLLPDHPNARIKVVKRPARGDPVVPFGMPVDEDAQAEVDKLMGHDPSIDRVVGYDLLPLPEPSEDIDPDRVRVARSQFTNRLFSHTFPMETSVFMPRSASEFMDLAAQSSDKIVIAKENIDASDPDSLSSIARYLPDRADVGVMQAVLFQQPSAEKAAAILDNVLPYVSDFLFITDFIGSNFQFIRSDWWHRPGSFAIYGMDLKQRFPVPQEIARFTTRGMTEMYLSRAGRELIINGQLPS